MLSFCITQWDKIMKNITKPFMLILIALLLIICGYLYYHYESTHPSTNDAYVGANVVNITPQVSGRLLHVYVHNHEWVKSGTLLFQINPNAYLIAVDKAHAALSNAIQAMKAQSANIVTARALLKQAKAQAINAQLHAKRMLKLVSQNLAPPSEGDSAKAALSIATASVKAAKSRLQQSIETLGKAGINNANIQSAKASLAQTLLALKHTKVYAPADGFINHFDLRPGQLVMHDVPLFPFVESHTWWVTANYKETHLSHIRAGQHASVILDMYPDHVFHGIVKSISTGSGATFSLLPAENASGNWVKVTQRFPVRISIHDAQAYPLRVGATADVTIHVK